MAGNAHRAHVERLGEHPLGARLTAAEVHQLASQRIARLPGARGLEAPDIRRLVWRMSPQSYEPGETIFRQGCHPDCLGLVVRGQIAVLADQLRGTRTVAVLLPGSTLGESLLGNDRPCQSTIQALTQCQVHFLHGADLRALAEERQAKQLKIRLRWAERLVGSGVVLLLLALLMLSLPVTRQALAVAPMGIGQWCSSQGYLLCSEEALGVATVLAPANPSPLLALSAHHVEQGNLETARALLNEAQAVAPQAAEPYNNLGLLYARQGNHTEAIRAFEKAQDLEPGIAATELNLASSLLAIEAYDQALDHYQAALALGSDYTLTLVNMAVAYYQAGKPEQALQAAQEALNDDPSLSEAHIILGAVALDQGNNTNALDHLQEATDLDPTSSQAHFYQGLAYKKMEMPQEAIRAFEEALAAADDEVDRIRIRQHLSELYIREGSGRTP